MPHERKTEETEVGGHRFLMTYFTPDEAIPIEGRLIQFLGPAFEGPASIVARKFLEVAEAATEGDPQELLLSLQTLIEEANKEEDRIEKTIAGIFKVNWGKKDFLALVRAILASVKIYTGEVAIPLVKVMNQDQYAHRDWTNTILNVTAWAAWKQFGIPFFSAIFAGESESEETLEEEPEE